ncbi:disease resistance protein RGA2-like [Triticum dicoccoides]|uniref:disease resistance protein RGA2-like n=1 Tax=Triticum dicoccoides TaxID=85692 RepID=UPI00188F1221|nr:disease resistance protein RGA2-like [Triticum dicoccoides]
MEVIFSAAMGELASRSISFLVDRYLKQRSAEATEEERLHSLQRLLLRLHVVVKEADDRLITNQAMLHQLSILRQEYRGYYTLDMFSCRAHEDDRTKDYSFAPSKFNPAKRVCFYSGNSEGAAQAELLEQVICSLRNTIEDVSEFVMFLNSYPCLHLQPYNMYLLLDKCMFGRQMEMELVMNFLLQAETAPGTADHLAVLPIIGPRKVGKSTLVEHVCNDERVRNHFSQILFLNGDDLKDASVETLRDGGRIKHKNRVVGGGRTLIIIELLLDIEEPVWKRLYSAAKSRIMSGSKMIIVSRSDKIASFGTTEPLRLQFLTHEAYWYFFKVRSFGSTRAEDHPKLASMAMEMVNLTSGCFMSANIVSGILKPNFNPHFWSMVLAVLRNLKKTNMSVYGDRFTLPWKMAEPTYLRRVNKNSSECVVLFLDYETCSAETGPEALRMMSAQDLLFGSVRLPGKFKVHAWTSHLPPHYSYIVHCEVQRPHRMVTSNKRFQKSSG